MTIKTQSIELCDANEKEDNKETLKLKDVVKIIPTKGMLEVN